MRQQGLWAVLTNARRSINVPSEDWLMVLMRHAHEHWAGPDGRESDDGSWMWTDEEAVALASDLVDSNSVPFPGRLRLDLDLGGGARGSSIASVADDVSPEERRLAVTPFLREGSFRWKFVSRPWVVH